MKKTLRLFALLLVIVFALVSCKQDPVVKVQQTPTIRGSVSIPEGTGLTGRDFYIRIMEGEKAVFTGRVSSDGTFSVPGLKENVSYNVLLTTEEPGDVRGSEKDLAKGTTSGYGGWLSNVSASINEQAGVGSVKVKPLGTIMGIVKKDGAEDHYDTTVYIPGTSYLAMTDGEGNFSIFNVPQSTYTLRYTANGYMAKMVDNVVLYSDSDTENPVTTVQLQTLIKNAGNLVGTISKIGSNDHSNITVMLSDGENTFTGSTAEDGSLLISNIIPGTYTATISTSGFLTQTVENIKIEAAKNTNIEPVNLTANGGSIIGTIILNNNSDKGGGIITARGVENGYSYTAGTDAEGRFVISGAFPGTYTVTISKTGFATVTIENVDSVAGLTTELGTTKLVSLYGSVSGKVSLSDSIDSSGVIIELRNVDDASIAPKTLSGTDGAYSFENLSVAGQYILTFSKDGFVSDSGKTVTVTPGANSQVEDVELRSLASKVSGKVTLAETEDHSGINILLKAKDNSIQYDATTDQQGDYVFARVKPGEYSLTVSKVGYLTKEKRSVIIGSSSDKILDSLSLEIGVRSIIGSVTLEEKAENEYSGVLVTATNLSNPKQIYSAISNSAGVYTLAEMKPGEYSITLSRSGYNTITLPTVNIVDGSVTELEKQDLLIARGTIYGSVKLEGRTDYSGVTVQILGKTGSDYIRTTDSKGNYSFYVPQGNYNGIQASKDDFLTETMNTVISLFAENGVPIDNIQLTATHVSVFGYVNVKETDDNSEVTVSIDGEPSFETYVTKSDGYFSFDHLPVGETYTFRFSRDFCADVTLEVTTKPSDGISLKTVNMLADSSAIEGNISLDGMTNNSGVTVYVDTVDGRLSTTTDASGYYYIGGLSTMGSYTVHAEKDGWNSAQVPASGLVALETSTLETMTLYDTTAPKITSLKLNGGANATGTRNVNVRIEFEEKGSGVRYMRYKWNDSEMSPWKDFSASFKTEIPGTLNGVYDLTVELKDNSGNITAQSVSESIALVGQIKTVSGVLTGEKNLHWKAEQNPIVVTGNITVGSGDELVIDPGVDVLFDGNYSINVVEGGYITAVGTEDNHIVFRSSKDYMSGYDIPDYQGYDGTWSGIIGGDKNLTISKNGYRYELINGNHLAFCDISDLSAGITGYLFIENSSITSSGYAIGRDSWDNSFFGSLINNTIKGRVHIRRGDNGNTNFYIFGNEFEGNFNYNQNYGYYDSSFYIYDSWNSECEFVNNQIREYSSVDIQMYRGECAFSTIDSCGWVYFRSSQDDKETFKYLKISNLRDPIQLYDFYGVEFSNFEGDFGDYVIQSSSGKTKNFNNNYWGKYTSEIDAYGDSSSNLSFIFDRYDDANYALVNISTYSSTPWSFAGYHKDGLFDIAVSYSNQEVKRGDDFEISITSTSDSIIDYYRISQTLNGLQASDWKLLTSDSIKVYYNSINPDALDSDGYLQFYVQGKTNDQETAIKAVRVPYDLPTITFADFKDGTVFTTENPIPVRATFKDSSSYIHFSTYVDGSLVRDSWYDVGNGYYNVWGEYPWTNSLESMNKDTDFMSPIKIGYGDHVLTIMAKDKAGNVNSLDVAFSIKINPPVLASFSLPDGDSVSDGNLSALVKLSNAKHIKEVRFYSDEHLLKAFTYEDNGSSILSNVFEIDNAYLSGGNHKLYVEIEDYLGSIIRSDGLDFSVEKSSTDLPVIDSISLRAGAKVGNTTTINVSATATNGVRSLYVYAGDVLLGSSDGRYLSYDSEYRSRTLTASLDFSKCLDGNQELRIVVADFSGTEAEETRTVTVSKEYPNIRITGYETRTEYIVKLFIPDTKYIKEATVYLDSAGSESLLIDNVAISDSGTWSKEITITKSFLNDGEYSIRAVFENLVSETKTYETGLSFMVDNNASFTENNLEGITQFKGILNDEARLHWTADMSPIVITGDITVASGKTLVIDPGVEVLFEGNYSITVRGTIEARGTKNNPIVFRSSAGYVENHEGYYGSWKGISLAGDLNMNVDGYKYEFYSGSIFEYCEIYDLSTGIVGRPLVDNCIIDAQGYALGYNDGDNWFRGAIVNSTVYGSVKLNDTRIVFGNEFNGSNVVNSYFCYNRWDSNSRFVNNLVTGYSGDVYMEIYYCIFEYNTISDITGNLYFRRYDDQNGAKYNEITRISRTIYLWSEFRGFQYSNITELKGNPQIYVDSSLSNREFFDMTYNYWGDANTAELQRASSSSANNASYIYDGYDDNNKTIIDWAGFVLTPWEDAGYKGDNFIDFSVPNRISETKIGDDITIELGMATNNPIDSIRFAYDAEDIPSAPWKSFSGSVLVIPGDEVNLDKVSDDGYLTIFIQAKSGEYTTAVKTTTMPYDYPRITEFNISATEINDDSSIRVSYKIFDSQDFGNNSYAQYVKAYMDGVLVDYWDSYFCDWNHGDYYIGTNYCNGEHVFKLEVADNAGNITELKKTITIEKPVSINVSERINEQKIGEDVTINISGDNLNPLDSVRYAFSEEGIEATEWQELKEGVLTIPYADIDMDKVSDDGYLVFYIQGKSNGYETAVKATTMPYDYPRITDLSLENNAVLSTDDECRITFFVEDASYDDYVSYVRVYLGDELYSEPWNYKDTDHPFTINPRNYRNGEYTLKIVVSDWAGNVTEETRAISIDRPVPATTGLEIDDGTIIAADGTMDLRLDIINAKHLRSVRFYSDGELTTERYFGDEGDNTRTENYQIDAHYLKSGAHTIKVEIADYSGNQTETKEYEYTVDGNDNGPEFSDINISDGDIIDGEFWMEYTTTSVKGVKTVSIDANDNRIWDGYWGDGYNPDSYRRQNSFWNSLWDLKNGEVTLTLRAVDFAGNETVETRIVTLQKSWPTVKATVYDKNTSFTINIDISSANNVTAVKVFANDALIGEFNTVNDYNQWNKEISKVKGLYEPGVYNISVELINRAGEPLTVTADKNVVVDNSIEFTENNLEGFTQISGQLNNDEWLHWTTAMSPIVITGPVTVPASKTLVIDPGVEVLFEGNYSITAKGDLKARGTAENPIVFRSSASNIENHEGYYGSWKGITLQSSLDVSLDGYKCTYNSGSIFEHCVISNLSEGIVGYAYVSDSTIESSNYALGNSSSRFNGVLIGNGICGNVRIEHNRFIFNNEFDGSSAVNSNFSYYVWGGGYYFINNYVVNYDNVNLDATYGVFEFNTIKDTGTLSLRRYYDTVMCYNEIQGVRNQIEIGGDFLGMEFSNISGLAGLPYAIKVTSTWGDNNRTSIDLTNNYWGELFTTELQRAKASSEQNVSFIYDSFDNADKMEVEWYDFVTTPWANAGYQGDDFVDFRIQDWVNEVKIGNDITIDVTPITTSSIDFIRVSQSEGDIESSEWQFFNGINVTIDGSAIDREKLSDDGYLTFFIQGKSGECITAVKSVRVPSDYPRITEFNISSTSITDDSRIRVSYKIFDSQEYGYSSSGQYVQAYMDDVLIDYWDNYFCDWSHGEYEIYPQNYSNGEHILKVVVADRAGNETELKKTITIERPIGINVAERTGEQKIGDNVQITVWGDGVNPIDSARFAFCEEEIDVAEWQNISDDGVLTIPYADLDLDKLSDDSCLTFFIQGRSGEYESVVKATTMPYDNPMITDISIDNNVVLSTDDSYTVTFHIEDVGTGNYLSYVQVYLNERLIAEPTREKVSDHAFTINPWNYRNGEYTLKFVVSDWAGNVTEETRTIRIDRPIPSTTGLSIAEGTVIAAGGSLNVRLDITNAKHLRSVRFITDEDSVYERTYNDGGDDVAIVNYSIDAHYMKSGEHTIKVELEDYSGNKTETDVYKYTVDGDDNGPVFSRITLNDGDVINGDFWYEFTAESLKGVKRIIVRVEDDVLWEGYWGEDYSSDSFKRNVSISNGLWYKKNGEKTISFYAVDFAGNETEETRTITLQKAWPTIRTTVYDKQLTFSVKPEVSDVSNVVLIKVLLDDELLMAYDCRYDGGYWTNEIVKSKSDYSAGEHTVVVELENRAGEIERFDAIQKVTIGSDNGFVENNLEGVTTIEGVLNDAARLHWTLDMSPIVITDNVTVASNKELIIDPGVEVLFEGNYSITVRGTITARGTKDKPIVFRSSAGYVDNHEGYYGSWKGISLAGDLNMNVDGYKYEFYSGSIFEYCEIYDLSTGIVGRPLVDNCIIDAQGYALGYNDGDNWFRGAIVNSTVYGSVKLNDTRIVFGNEFNGSNVVNSYFCYNRWDSNSRFVNNLVTGYSGDVYMEIYYCIFEYNTISDITGNLYFRRYDDQNGAKYNEITRISRTIYLWSEFRGFQYSNITELKGNPQVYVDSSLSNRESFDMTCNYWGDVNTAELQRAKNSSGMNAAFIYDGYDDNNKTVIDWDGFVTTPWENAGYKGDSFIDFILPNQISEVRIGEDITITITPATTNEINFIRVAQSVEGIETAQWQSFNGSDVTVAGSAIDRDQLSDDGYLTFYIQAKCGDYLTAIKSVRVASDYPRVNEFNVSSTEINDDSNITITYKIFDSQEYGDHSWGSFARAYVDDVLIGNWDYYFCDYVRTTYTVYPRNYQNGEHVLKFVIADRAGNETVKEISFTIDRPIPSLDTVAFEGGTTVLANGSLKANLSITNANHLRYVRFYSDDDKVFERYYDDNGDESRTESIELDAHYLKAGTHNIYVELEDHSGNKTESDRFEFTVEGVNVGPVFTSISLKDGDTIGDSFGVSMAVASEKGVKSVSISLGDNEIWSDNRDSYSSDRDKLEYSWLGSWDITNRPDGEVEFKLKAVDFAGNETEETRTLVIQKSWPTVKTTVYNKKISFSIKPEVSDVSRINMIRILIDGELLLAYDCSNSSGNWSNEILKSKTGYSVGEYVVEVELENNIGEKKTFTADKNIVVDDTAGGFVENNLEGVTTIEGMLNDDARLHWTEAMSPVVITGNITVAAGKTLVIDPAVEVLFEGNYSITVRGNIDARGTEDDPIVFRSSAGYVQNHEGYYGTWKGITLTDSLNVTINGYDCIFNSGSIFEHCEISDISDGIVGKAYINDSTISSSGYALGNSNGSVFGGVLVNSEVYGSVRLEYNQLVFNTTFDGSSSADPYFRIYNHSNGYKFVNNLVTNYNDVDLSIYECVFEFNTIRNISGVIRVRRYDNERGTRYNEIDNVSGTIYLYDPCNGLQYSNITNLKGSRQIYVEANWNANSSFDMSNNYWGDANTVELQRAKNSAGKNASFIYDGYDDNNKAMVVWDNFVSSEWEFAGYKGDGFIDFDASLVQAVSSVNEIKIGNDIPFKLTLKSGGTISKYRIAQSMEDLFSEDWQNYAGGCYLNASDIDESKIEDGKIKAFIQIKTLAGVESAPVICTVSHDVPAITFNAIREGDVITSTSLIPIQAEFYDSSNGTHFMTYIDGNIKCEGGYGYLGNGFYNIWGGYPWTTNPNDMSENDYLDPAAYGNGEHTLTIFAEDRVGNTTTKVIHFTIQIAPPSLTSVELSNDGVVGEGESLTVSVRIDNAENLKTVKILSDGDEIISKTIEARVPTFSEVFTISSDYLRTGPHKLEVVMEDRVGGTITSPKYDYTATGDDTAPTIGGFDVTEGQEFSNNEVKVWELAVNDDIGVKNIFFDIDGVRINQYIARDLESSDKSIDQKIRFKVYGYQNGDHTLTVTATDFAGNETVISRNVTVNKAIPSVTLYSADESSDSVRYYAHLSNRAWMYDGYILLDGEILKYFMINSMNNDNWGEEYWTDSLSFNNLPVGTHTVQAIINSQGGDRIESEILTFTNTREKSDSKYGLNKTWNADGTLIADNGTKYLWSFDDSMGLSYESVSDKNLGTVKASTEGFGSKAGSMYFSNDDEISFFNSEWTLEYWAKDEYGGTDCIDIDIRNVINTNNDHNSANSDSLINAWYYYLSGTSDSSATQEWFGGARSSRAERSNWHHYAIVSTGDRFEMYMDGVLTAYSNGNRTSSRKANGLYIDMTDTAYIDELRISDVARSADELWDYVQYVKSNNLLPD